MTNPHFTRVLDERNIESHNMYSELRAQGRVRPRKRYRILRWGDYLDLLPDHPRLWCYCPRNENETLAMATNFSAQTQGWYPPDWSRQWEILIGNYPDRRATAEQVVL